MSKAAPDFYAGDLFGELHPDQLPAARRSLRDYLPGLAVAGTASLAAAFLAQSYGFPIVLLGLLLGFSLAFVGEIEATAPGLDFASRYLLQLGIVLLGLQVTFAQAASLGWLAFAGLLAVMLAALGSALLAARMVGEKWETGLLAGGATAICGASAALALYGVIGRDRIDQARFSVTLVGIALASALAMSAYPALARIMHLSDTQAGFLIGASVHDAAQAIGGAFSYSDAAGRSATVVKLSRVALLAPMVALTALAIRRSSGAGKAERAGFRVPWFITGFFLVLALNSFLAIPEPLTEGALALSKACLLLAVTATAMRSRLGLLVEAGWRTLTPVFAATLVSFLAALLVALALS